MLSRYERREEQRRALVEARRQAKEEREARRAAQEAEAAEEERQIQESIQVSELPGREIGRDLLGTIVRGDDAWRIYMITRLDPSGRVWSHRARAHITREELERQERRRHRQAVDQAIR